MRRYQQDAALTALTAESAAAIATAKTAETLAEENDRAQKFINGFKENLEVANKQIETSRAELETRWGGAS